MIRAVLFDLDNTLIDRDAAFRQFCRDWLDRSWPDLDRDERLQALARMVQRDQSVLSRDLPTNQICRESEAALPADGEMPDWYDQIWSDAWDEEKRNGLSQRIRPDADVTHMICRLRNRFPLAVVTNGSSKNQRAKLRASGMAELFEHVIISGERLVSKPDPMIFEAALSQLGCRAQDALFVGDDPVRDVIGAKVLGMTVAWVSRGRQWSEVVDGTGRPLPYQPDYQVNHVTELETSVTCLT